jgi:hypothetical protein
MWHIVRVEILTAVNKEHYFLRCDAVYSRKILPTFWWFMHKHFLRDVYKPLPNQTASYYRTKFSSLDVFLKLCVTIDGVWIGEWVF